MLVAMVFEATTVPAKSTPAVSSPVAVMSIWPLWSIVGPRNVSVSWTSFGLLFGGMITWSSGSGVFGVFGTLPGVRVQLAGSLYEPVPPFQINVASLTDCSFWRYRKTAWA
jgi:hypothetical protein